MAPAGRILSAAAAVVLFLAGAITLAAVLRQPAPVTVRTVRIAALDGPRDNQHVVLDASFFTPAGQGTAPGDPARAGFR